MVGIWLLSDLGTLISWLVQECVTVRKGRDTESAEDWHSFCGVPSLRESRLGFRDPLKIGLFCYWCEDGVQLSWVHDELVHIARFFFFFELYVVAIAKPVFIHY